MNVARGDRIADPIKQEFAIAIAASRLGQIGDQCVVVDLSEIPGSRLEAEIELVERDGPMLDNDLVGPLLDMPLAVFVEERPDELVALAAH